MEKRTIWNEDESRVVHLHSADINDVVKIEYEAVSVVYQIQDLRFYAIRLVNNEPMAEQLGKIWDLPCTTG